MKIGDVARRSGVSARMLRYYDRIGLVQPSGRTRGGYRDYDDSDLRRLLHVEALRSLGLPLRQVAHVLDDAAATPTEILDRVIARTAEAITREQELLARLLRLRDQQPEAWADVLSTVSLLQRLGSSSASERQRAALTDPRPPIPSALAEAALTEDDPNVAGALQWALARSADDATLAALGDALESGDPDTRRRAITALVKIASPTLPGVAPLLERAVRHADPIVRGRAALALGRAGAPAATAELLAMIVRGTDDVEAAEALGVLARTPGNDITTRLDKELSTLSDPDARLRLTQALGELDDDAATGILDRLAADPDHRVRLTARYLRSRVAR